MDPAPGQSAWEIWPRLAAVAAILAAAPVFALAATWAYTEASGASAAGVTAPGVLAERQALQSVVYFAALHGAVLALSLAAVRAFDGSIRKLGLCAPAGRLRDDLLAGMVLLTCSALWLAFLAWLMPEAVAAETGDFARYVRSGWGMLLFPVLTVLAPIAEEVMFRGFLFSALRSTYLGLWGGAVLSSLLWSSLHVGTSLLVRGHLAAAGIGLCWLVARTGGLRRAIFLHVIFNSALGLVLVLMVPD